MPDPALILREAYDTVRRDYGRAIGQRRDELITPALVLDIDAAQRNIDHMASELKQMGAATIRPHYKTHKSPDLARRQLQAGAGGLSMATVWEAAILAAAGMDDLFVVNTVAHPAKLRVLAELARGHRVLVAVDEAENAASASAAAVTAGSTLGIMVEVDTGMDRCGTDNAADCLALARQVADLPGLRFEGITGYEGHCSMTPDHDLRHERQRAAMKFFTDVAGQLEADGIPCPIRSAGGIATWNWTAAYPGVTEIQAGTYVVMVNHDGWCPSEHSLHRRRSSRARQQGHRKQQVDADPTDVTMVGHDHPVLRFDRTRHLDAADGSHFGSVTGRLVPGTAEHSELVRRLPRTQGDIVVDIWPVIARFHITGSQIRAEQPRAPAKLRQLGRYPVNG